MILIHSNRRDVYPTFSDCGSDGSIIIESQGRRSARAPAERTRQSERDTALAASVAEKFLYLCYDELIGQQPTEK